MKPLKSLDENEVEKAVVLARQNAKDWKYYLYLLNLCLVAGWNTLNSKSKSRYYD